MKAIILQTNYSVSNFRNKQISNSEELRFSKSLIYCNQLIYNTLIILLLTFTYVWCIRIFIHKVLTALFHFIIPFLKRSGESECSRVATFSFSEIGRIKWLSSSVFPSFSFFFLLFLYESSPLINVVLFMMHFRGFIFSKVESLFKLIPCKRFYLKCYFKRLLSSFICVCFSSFCYFVLRICLSMFQVIVVKKTCPTHIIVSIL